MPFEDRIEKIRRALVQENRKAANEEAERIVLVDTEKATIEASAQYQEISEVCESEELREALNQLFGKQLNFTIAKIPQNLENRPFGEICMIAEIDPRMEATNNNDWSQQDGSEPATHVSLRITWRATAERQTSGFTSGHPRIPMSFGIDAESGLGIEFEYNSRNKGSLKRTVFYTLDSLLDYITRKVIKGI